MKAPQKNRLQLVLDKKGNQIDYREPFHQNDFKNWHWVLSITVIGGE